MQPATQKNGFFIGVLFATLVPLLTLPFLAALKFPFDQSLALGLFILAGGVGHVASTACVYADKAVRDVMKPMKLRFYALPLGVIAITLAAVFWGSSLKVSESLVVFLFTVHLFWLHFHYQKQNYGLVAFVAASESTRVPRMLSWLLLIPALAGVLAIMPSLMSAAFGEANFYQPYQATFYSTAVVIYLIGVLVIGILVAKNFSSFAKPRTAVMATASTLFFLPAVLVGQSEYAFWSYATAHGFQYLLMVYLMTGGPKLSLRPLAAFFVALVCGGFLLHRLTKEGIQILFLCGIMLNWVHFILDAKIWRMSEPGPRKLLRGRFAFLFSK